MLQDYGQILLTGKKQKLLFLFFRFQHNNVTNNIPTHMTTVKLYT